MRKVFCLLLVFIVLLSNLMPVAASSESNEKDEYIKYMLDTAKSIFDAAPRLEGKFETGLGNNGPIYTVYPVIKKEVRDNLIAQRLEEIKGILQQYELEVLKEGFEEFKQRLKETALFRWLPEHGTPQYPTLTFYKSTLIDVFMRAEFRYEKKQVQAQSDKKDTAYQNTWEAGMPSVWAYEKIAEAIKLNYVPSNIQNNYQAPITREEFSELFVTAIFEEVNNSNSTVAQNIKNNWEFDKLTVDNFLSKVKSSEYFTDTNNKYVLVANMLGIVNGTSEHKFNPTSSITREQMAEMISNYIQTLIRDDTRVEDFNQLSDLSITSSRSQDAIKIVYLAGMMNAVKPPKLNNDKLVEKEYFDNKGIITREQAILIIMKLHENAYGGSMLDHLLLRGYVMIDMEELMSGFDIDGDTIKMKKSGRDSKPYVIDKYMHCFGKIRKTSYIFKYPSEVFDAVFLGYHTKDMFETAEMDKVLSGKETLYDYKIYKIEHNKNGYLVTITKSDKYNYFYGDSQFIDNGKLVTLNLNRPKGAEENKNIVLKSSFKTEVLRKMERNTYVTLDSTYPQQWYYKDKTGKFQYGDIKPIGTQIGYAIELDKEVYLNGKPVKSYSIGGETAIMLDELKYFGYDYKLISQDFRSKGDLIQMGKIELYIPTGHSIKKYDGLASNNTKSIEGNSIYTLVGDKYSITVKDKEKNKEVGGLRCYKAKTGERFILIDDLWSDEWFYYYKTGGAKDKGLISYALEGSISPPTACNSGNNDLAVVEHINDKYIKINLLSRDESYKLYHRSGHEHYLAYQFPQLSKLVFSPDNYEAWIAAKNIVAKSITNNMNDAEKVTAITNVMSNYGFYAPGPMVLDLTLGADNHHSAYQALIEKYSNYSGWFDAYRMLLVQAGLETFPEDETGSVDKEWNDDSNHLTGLIAVKVDGVWKYINFLPPVYQ